MENSSYFPTYCWPTGNGYFAPMLLHFQQKVWFGWINELEDEVSACCEVEGANINNDYYCFCRTLFVHLSVPECEFNRCWWLQPAIVEFEFSSGGGGSGGGNGGCCCYSCCFYCKHCRCRRHCYCVTVCWWFCCCNCKLLYFIWS